MNNLMQIRNKVKISIEDYDIHGLKKAMEMFVGLCEQQDNISPEMSVVIRDLFNAYKEHNYMMIYDIFQYVIEDDEDVYETKK